MEMIKRRIAELKAENSEQMKRKKADRNYRRIKANREAIRRLKTWIA